MSRRIPIHDDDDGRTVAPMNVEGMPWHARPAQTPERRRVGAGEPDCPPLSRREALAVLGGTMKAVLLIGLAFGVGILAVILFCDLFWLR